MEKYEYHSDSSCTTDLNTWETSHVSLSIGDEQTFATYGSSGGTGHLFTTTLSENTYTPHTSSVVSWANTNSWCGLTGWELNTPQSISGKTCGSVTYFSKETAVYGMYILDGSKFMPSWTSSSSYPDSVSSETSNTFVKQ